MKNWRNWQDLQEDEDVQIFPLIGRGDPTKDLICIVCGERFDSILDLKVYLMGAGDLCPRCYLEGLERVNRYRPEWKVKEWDASLLAKIIVCEKLLWQTPALSDEEIDRLVNEQWQEVHGELCQTYGVKA